MNEDNKYDALKEILQQKLENHQTPVDSSVWNAINHRLNKKSSSTKKLIVIWGSIAASVAIVLAMAFLHHNSQFDQLSENHNFPEKACEKPVLAIDSVGCETIVVVPQQPTKTQMAAVSLEIQENPIIEDVSDEPSRPLRPLKPLEPSVDAAVEFDQKQHLSLTKKEHKALLLSAFFNTNQTTGSIENNTSTQPPLYASSLRSTNIYQSGDEILSPNKALIPDNTTGEHLAPLSFGLTLRKNIDKHWGVETGLVYTYLSSTYRWDDPTPFDAAQQLHYLGIPVNGVVYLWNNHSQWNVYFSAGVMLEKGLRMRTIRNQYLPEKVVTSTQNSNIDGWQWSLNSSLGISYRIADKMKLYVEPRLGYYFDNNQPVSIRTNRPVSFGFGAGLQFSL